MVPGSVMAVEQVVAKLFYMLLEKKILDHRVDVSEPDLAQADF